MKLSLGLCRIPIDHPNAHIFSHFAGSIGVVQYLCMWWMRGCVFVYERECECGGAKEMWCVTVFVNSVDCEEKRDDERGHQILRIAEIHTRDEVTPAVATND